MNPNPGALRIMCSHAGKYPDKPPFEFWSSTPSADGRSEVARWPSGKYRVVPRQQLGGQGPTLRCRTCKRNPRPSRRDWHQLCEAWRRAGHDTVDISAREFDRW